ncbi:MAG TPA: Rieske 2Fe-2S domain-containing protein [Candidatus Dormibacteraeota bacterium]|nr:Rieske 2Fe-2S domain-containing protein [Candidatus Dormibacteraeota bacterium]
MRYLVGRVADFKPCEIRVIEIEGQSIGIIYTGEEYFAVLNICPHELAPVCAGTLSGTVLPCQPGEPVYSRESRILRCPWHGYEFDLGNDGRAAFTSFRGRLRLFPVIVEDNCVFVEMRARRQRPAKGD